MQTNETFFVTRRGIKWTRCFCNKNKQVGVIFGSTWCGIGVAQTKRGYRPSLPENTPACTFKTWSNWPEPGYKDVTTLELFKLCDLSDIAAFNQRSANDDFNK